MLPSDKWIVLNAVARNVINSLKDAGVYVKPKESDQKTIRGIIDKLPEHSDCSRI